MNDYQAVNGAMADANGQLYSAWRGDPYDNAGQTAADAKPWILVRSVPFGKHWFPYPPSKAFAARAVWPSGLQLPETITIFIAVTALIFSTH